MLRMFGSFLVFQTTRYWKEKEMNVREDREILGNFVFVVLFVM